MILTETKNAQAPRMLPFHTGISQYQKMLLSKRHRYAYKFPSNALPYVQFDKTD
jgi:hypothetical protein